jgi:competence protein ComEC
VAGGARGVHCDGYGCIGRARSNFLVAVSLRRDALAEDCAAAYIIVSAVPLRGTCIGPKLAIDRFDVARNGAYAVWIGEKIRTETVQRYRGDRPWSREAWQPRAKRPKFNSGG